MAGRNDCSFEGVGTEYATFKYDGSIVYDQTKIGGSVSVGLAVKMTGQKQVGLTTDACVVKGKIIKVEPDGFCNIAYEGHESLPYGTGIVAGNWGKKFVGALDGGGNGGYIRPAAAVAGAFAQAGLQEVANATGSIIDDSDITAVVVDFD